MRPSGVSGPPDSQKSLPVQPSAPIQTMATPSVGAPTGEDGDDTSTDTPAAGDGAGSGDDELEYDVLDQ
jgi:hypothetical protein